MTDHGRSRKRRARLGLVLTAGVAVLGTLIGVSAPLAGASPTYKYYSSSATPMTIYYQGTTTVSVSLSNSSSSNQPFGSAEITPGSLPQAAITNPVVSPSTGWHVVFADPSNLSDSTLLLTSDNGYGVVPGGTVTVSFGITPPAGTTSIPITTSVKQSNDFSGTGNNFKRQGSDTTLTVTSQVSLSFSQQPTTVQAPVNGVYQYMCPPVSVLASVGGTPIDGISVALGPASSSSGDPGLYWNGSLASSTNTIVEQTGTDGLAVFGNCTTGLSATNVGSGYVLEATSQSATGPVDSSPFSVVQYHQLCQSSNCSTGSLNSSTGTVGQVNTTTLSGSYYLEGSFNQGTLVCDKYVTKNNIADDPLLADATPAVSGGSAYAMVTMTFPKTVVNSLANNGTPLMQVCAGATVSFPGSTYYPPSQYNYQYDYQGLLPDCTGSYIGDPTQFCVASRNKNAGATETIQIYVGANYSSDPSFW